MEKPTIEIDFNGPEGNIFCVLLEANKAIEVLKANGEDAYIMGEIVKSEEKVTIC